MSEPTVQDVHVNAPLSGMSIGTDQSHLSEDELQKLLRRLIHEALGGGISKEDIIKIYPHEHAGRQLDPSTHKVVGSKEIAPGIRQLYAIKDGKSVVQSIRFDSAKYTAEAAKAWLKKHGYSESQFEAAVGKAAQSECEECGEPTDQDELDENDGVCSGCAESMQKTDVDVSKTNLEWNVELLKGDSAERVSYGVVYPIFPKGQADSQSDFASEEEVRRMAYDFMVKSQAYDEQHRRFDLTKDDAVVVESWLAPTDFDWPLPVGGMKHITKGSWIVATKYSPEMWNKVCAGEIASYSIRGKGKRIPVTA